MTGTCHDDHGGAAMPTGMAGVEPGRLQLRCTASAPQLKYFLYVPKGCEPTQSRRALVVVHGIARNARGHALSLIELAQALRVPLIAPVFDGLAGDAYQRVWPQGIGSRADHQLHRIFVDAGRAIDAVLHRMLLWGYSAGAQFAHRYAMAYPHRVEALALGAPGWYTTPRRDVAFPLGIGAGSLPHDVHLDPAALLHRPILVSVGAADDKRDRSLRCDAELDAMQGLNRVERARHWVQEMEALAQGLRIAARIVLRVQPGVAHDFDADLRAGLVGDLARFFSGATPASRATAAA